MFDTTESHFLRPWFDSKIEQLPITIMAGRESFTLTTEKIIDSTSIWGGIENRLSKAKLILHPLAFEIAIKSYEQRKANYRQIIHELDDIMCLFSKNLCRKLDRPQTFRIAENVQLTYTRWNTLNNPLIVKATRKQIVSITLLITITLLLCLWLSTLLVFIQPKDTIAAVSSAYLLFNPVSLKANSSADAQLSKGQHKAPSYVKLTAKMYRSDAAWLYHTTCFTNERSQE